MRNERSTCILLLFLLSTTLAACASGAWTGYAIVQTTPDGATMIRGSSNATICALATTAQAESLGKGHDDHPPTLRQHCGAVRIEFDRSLANFYVAARADDGLSIFIGATTQQQCQAIRARLTEALRPNNKLVDIGCRGVAMTLDGKDITRPDSP